MPACGRCELELGCVQGLRIPGFLGCQDINLLSTQGGRNGRGNVFVQVELHACLTREPNCVLTASQVRPRLSSMASSISSAYRE